MTDRLEPCLERLEHLGLIEVRKLLAKTLQITKCMLIDEADQPKQFEERVLERRRRQKQLRTMAEREFERVRNYI
jgi:hypothetical protein